MAGDDDQLSDPIGPPDGTVFAVGIGVGLVTLLGLLAAVALVVSAHGDLLRPVG